MRPDLTFTIASPRLTPTPFVQPISGINTYELQSAKVGEPTRWPPGQSGNPAGKPPGTRTAFSQGFIRDFALVWAEESLEAVRKVAKKSPEAFVAIAARICPNDVRLTLEQAIPGGMSLEDYSLMREVIAALREGLPDADQMQPGVIFQHVLGALRDCSKIL